MELRTDATLLLDPLRPRNDHSIACPTEVRGNLLCPLERRGQAVRPANGIMVERQRTAEIIHVRHDLLEVFRYRVEEGHLIERTLLAALSARAIVTLNIDDEGVVQLTKVLNRVEEQAHLVVRLVYRRAINLHTERVDLQESVFA